MNHRITQQTGHILVSSDYTSLSVSMYKAVLSHMPQCVHVTTYDRCTQSIFCESLFANDLASLR